MGGEDGAPPTNTTDILFGGEDEMDVDEDLPMNNALPSQSTTNGAKPEGQQGFSSLLLNQIITPSPYPQHNSGPTSSRFRNALNRVLQQPDKDVEAWQALLTEVYTCYTNISDVHAVDAETQTKLDWVESCYGHFLRFYPFSPQQAVTVVDILLKQSARVGEESGPLVDYYYGKPPKRALLCEQKLEGLMKEWLGIANFETGEMAPLAAPTESTNGSSDPRPKHRLTGICSWVVELWLLYVKKKTRDAGRVAQATLQTVEQRSSHVRDATKQAFEAALPHCGFSHNNHLIWSAYLDFVKGWNDSRELAPGSAEHAAATQQQMMQLRSIYQRLVTHPMTGLDQLWHEYEAWERNQSEALAVALNQEFSPKYQHARTIYLERNRVYNKETELQLGQRLAVSPVRREDCKDDDDYFSQMTEEHRLLTSWKKRCSYERTNPERVPASELVIRVRAAYKEMVSVLARHPETWQMWATYELFRNAGGAAASTSVATPSEAVSVLQLGQELIPTSTLLAYEEAKIVESYMQQQCSEKEKKEGTLCLGVMERVLERNPTTLGFVLLQQMVRRYKGIQGARAVFGRARRTLVDPDDTREASKKDTATGDVTTTEQNPDNEEAVDPTVSQNADGEDKDGSASSSRWMVTNKLSPSIGNTKANSDKFNINGNQKVENNLSTSPEQPDPQGSKVGRITWHLYAAHASMEHRMNHSLEIAARVYELGLRRHKHFLTKSTYVLRYAELLMELGDTVNLRALLTKAVAASSSSEQAPLLDLMLRLETILSGTDAGSLANVNDIERQRREAIFGASVEDVATGGFVGNSTAALISAQKSSIAEHLIRGEGYDLGSRIVSGLGRTADVLEVMGFLGSGQPKSSIRKNAEDATVGNDELPGGESDSSFQRRLEFSDLSASGDRGGEGGGGGTRSLTARERMQQAVSGGAGAGAGGGPATAIMLAIQQMPEWLRPLLFLLPASRLRLPVVAKPPPHLVEVAFNTLRQNELPSERPNDKSADGNKVNKRKSGDDSSDDEDGNAAASGFGNAFRVRQRARITGIDVGSH